MKDSEKWLVFLLQSLLWTSILTAIIEIESIKLPSQKYYIAITKRFQTIK